MKRREKTTQGTATRAALFRCSPGSKRDTIAAGRLRLTFSESAVVACSRMDLRCRQSLRASGALMDERRRGSACGGT
jgi:hypothetical protein